MQTNKPHKNADAIKAWADGKTVQFKNYTTKGKWKDFDSVAAGDYLPDFGGDAIEWRVKPEAVTGWLNIYPAPEGSGFDHYASHVYQTKHGAACRPNIGTGDRIACVPVTYTEGEGL